MIENDDGSFVNSDLEQSVLSLLNKSKESLPDDQTNEEFNFEVLLRKVGRSSEKTSINILEFWEDIKLNKKHEFSKIAEIALVMLSVPATQASVERCFSILKFILNHLGTNIDENILTDILLINLNKSLKI